MKKQRFPVGWDTKRVQRVLAHYESQSDDESIAEDEAAYEQPGQTMMIVPTERVPDIQELVAKRFR